MTDWLKETRDPKPAPKPKAKPKAKPKVKPTASERSLAVESRDEKLAGALYKKG